MAKLKNKTTIILCSVLIVASLISTGFIITGALSGQSATWSGETLNNSYDLGVDLTIPDRTVTVGDETVTASHCVIFPDGSSSYADTISLNISGRYELTYTAKIGEKVYNDTHGFQVVNALFAVSDPESSAVYTTDPGNTRYDTTSGVLVNLVKGDTLTFNQLISVDDLVNGNYFIEGLIYPESIGASGFSRLTITLTDVNNPEIYVNITLGERLVVDERFGEAYAYAGGNGQSMVGVQTDGSGNYQKHFTDDGFGQSIYLPFRGKHTIGMPSGVPNYTYEVYADDYPFRLSFDADSKEIWHSTNYNNTIDGKDYDQTKEPNKDDVHMTSNAWNKIVTDLDNPTYYNTLWSGFESDYVRLTVSADKYNAKYATFCITNVVGMDLSVNSFEITSAPTITVQGEANSLPVAKVGGTYPLTAATAFDVYSGDVDVKTNVYYNYFSDDKVAVKMEDGKFSVPYEGYYAIVYTASNHVGNVSEKVLWVYASTSVEPIGVTFGEYASTSLIGEFIPYATAELSGGSGEKSVVVYAKHKESGEIITTKDGFVPEKTGVWQVIYEATDYIGQITTVNYEVTVERNENPVLVDSVVLPKVFISGGRFALPEIYGNVYSGDEKTRVLCKVRIVDANGTKEYDAGSEFVPEVSANGDLVKVTYLCNGKELYSQDVMTVVPYNGATLDFGAYFITNDSMGEKTEEGYVLTSNDGTDKISFLYANPIVAQNMEITLRCPVKTANYNEIIVTLTDANDNNNVVEAVFRQENGKVKLFVGDKVYETANSFSADNFNLQLKFANNSFVFADLSFPVLSTVSGEEFEGFSSDKVYISVSANNASVGSQIGVVSIRDYAFKTQPRDVIKPYFVSYDKNGIGIIGQNYTIIPISAGDVISHSVSVLMKVIDPDGEVVISVDGVNLDNCDAFAEHIITTSKVGDYKVMYTISENDDFEARKFTTNYTFTIKVYDTVAPTVEFTSKHTETAKVGDTLIFPNFTVTDNDSTSDEMIIYVYVINPNGMLQSIDANLVNGKIEDLDKNSIVCSTAGEYTLQVMAIDASGNITVAKKTVTVE